MIAGLMLTIGSLFFIILLLIVYFSKQRFLSIRNKIYRYMLVVEVILLISELIATLCVIYCDNDFINFLIYRVHWSTGIVWFSLLYYYSLVFISDINANNLLEVMVIDKKTKIMSIIFMIAAIGYFFIPFETLDPNWVSYIPGPASYYVLGFCAFSVFSIVYYILKNGKNVSSRKKISVSLMIIELVIIFVLQILFPYIAKSAKGAAVQMYF